MNGNPAKRSKLLAICKQRNITVTKLPSGCYWLSGPATDILVRDIESLQESDLQPYLTVNG